MVLFGHGGFISALTILLGDKTLQDEQGYIRWKGSQIPQLTPLTLAVVQAGDQSAEDQAMLVAESVADLEGMFLQSDAFWSDDKKMRERFEIVNGIHDRLGISALEVNLRLWGNKDAGKTARAIQAAVKQGKKIIVEVASGNTANALDLARNNPDALVLATDRYDTNSKRLFLGGTTLREYLPYAVAFENNQLPAQKSDLDNLLVVRSLADILLYLPDSSVDSVVFVKPPIAAMDDMIALLKDFGILKKLKGAEIAICTGELFMHDYFRAFLRQGVYFDKQIKVTTLGWKKAVFIFRGTNLRKNSDWPKGYLQGLYLAKIRDAAMTTDQNGLSVRQISGVRTTPFKNEGVVKIDYDIRSVVQGAETKKVLYANEKIAKEIKTYAEGKVF